MHRYRKVWGRHCRRLRHNSHSFPAHLLKATTVPVVFSDYSGDKIMSLHRCCIALYLSWVPSPILYSCSEENRMTAWRASPLLEPDCGSTEKGNLPSLGLRSDTLPKLFSLVYQHCPLSSPISFSSILSFIISQVPQGCNGLQTPPIAAAQ